MSVIFESKDSVFFIGGRGAKTGDQYAGGGCTKDFWGDLKSPSKTLADVMDANGLALSSVAAGLGNTACDVVNNGSGKVRITKAGQDYFIDCCAGLIARIDFAAVYTDGRYEVTAVDGVSGEWIDIDETYSVDTTCGTQVGGAFNQLQIASDNTDANSTTPHSVYILTNKSEVFTGVGSQIDIDVGGGDGNANTWKCIIGIDDNGVELADGSYLTIDGNNYACDIINIDDVSHISIHHIYAYDVGSTKAAFNFGNRSNQYGFLLEECKATDCAYGVIVQGSAIRNLSIIGGDYRASLRAFYFKSIFFATIRGAYLYAEGSYVIYSSYYGFTIQDCVLESDGTAVGVSCGSVYLLQVVNCTFYNITEGIELNNPNTVIVEYNNIFIVGTKASGKAIKRTGGSIAFSDYSCLWALDGAPAAADRWGGNDKPEHAIEEDPDFVDAAIGNFRLRNPNVLRGGKPDMAGNVTQMGAVMQEYKFAKRAKTANFGRMQTVR